MFLSIMQFKFDIAAVILFIINITIINSQSEDIWDPQVYIRQYRDKILNNEPSCNLINATIPAYMTVMPERKCMCDQDCKIYKDCCKDSVYYDENEQLNESIFQCNADYEVYMIATCPPGYNSSNLIREKCENSSLHADSILRSVSKQYNDLFAPVFVIGKNITFANAYCAQCHQEWKYVSWNNTVKCLPLNEAPSRLNGIRNGSYHILNQRRFSKCLYNATHPERLTVLQIRACISAISRCEINKNLQNVCRSYTAYVRDGDGMRYKNADCARCNNVTKTSAYYSMPFYDSCKIKIRDGKITCEHVDDSV